MTTLTLDVNNSFLISKQKPPKAATFPEICRAKLWYDISWSRQFDVSMTPYFDRQVFRNFDFLAFLIRIFLFLCNFHIFR